MASTPEAFFAQTPLGLAAFTRVSQLLRGLGPYELRVSKSQVAFRHDRGFAFLWLPGTYLAHPAAEVVLSIALDRRLESARFKAVVNPAPGHWMHHLEIHDLSVLDAEVEAWLRLAYETAANP